MRTRNGWMMAAGVAGLAAMAAPAMGQFVEDFEDLTPGNACGQGGWEPWDLNELVCGEITTEQANSGTKSMKLVGADGPGGDDMVHDLGDVTGGTWVFSVMTYVPSDAAGNGWVILLNEYSPGGTKNWSLQVSLDADVGEIQDDPINIIPPVDTAPLVFDEWVEFRAVIDLDNDSVDYYYNDELFVEDKSWTDGVPDGNPGGLPVISTVDLWGDEPPVGTTGMYYDDIVLEPAGDTCLADCDGNGTLNILDFVCFQGLFQGGDSGADCDGNGQLNILDFVCFQGAFQDGCP